MGGKCVPLSALVLINVVGCWFVLRHSRHVHQVFVPAPYVGSGMQSTAATPRLPFHSVPWCCWVLGVFLFGILFFFLVFARADNSFRSLRLLCANRQLGVLSACFVCQSATVGVYLQ